MHIFLRLLIEFIYDASPCKTLQPNALRRSALIQGKDVTHSLNYYRFSSRNQQHRREGVSDKEKQLRIAGSVLLVRDQVSNCFDTVSRALYAAPHLVKRFNQQHCVEVP